MPQLEKCMYVDLIVPLLLLYVISLLIIVLNYIPRTYAVLYVRRGGYKKKEYVLWYGPLEQFEIWSNEQLPFLKPLWFNTKFSTNLMIETITEYICTIWMSICNMFYVISGNFIINNAYSMLGFFIILIISFLIPLRQYRVLPISLGFFQAYLEILFIVYEKFFMMNCGVLHQRMFPVGFHIFLFISICNLLGLIPYGFTLTSHLVFTLFFSFSLFGGITIESMLKNKLKFWQLFLPNGTPLVIMPFLFLIELVSYISRVFSLAIRLFANMMSGHILLTILTGLFMQLSQFDFGLGVTGLIVLVMPFLFLILIISLECGVALLQAYVFVVLWLIYVQELTLE